MAKKPARGLVIRDDIIEILELSHKREGMVVSGYGWARLAEGVVRNGRVVNSKVLGEETAKLIRSSGVKAVKGPVALGLLQSQVFLKVFTIPEFEEKEMREAISWHVGSLAPVLPKDAYNSYELVGKGSNKGEVKVLLVSAQKMIVDGYLEAMEQAGVEVELIEPLAMSRVRLIEPKMLIGKSVASVHLYGGRLSVEILVNAKLWFSKETTVFEGQGKVIEETTAEMIKFFTEKREKDVAGVSEIIISGDKAGREELEKNLAGFNLKLVKAEPGMVLKPSKAIKEVEMIEFAPVLGLAIRGWVQHQGMINLLPLWPKEKIKLEKLRQLLAKTVVIAGMVVWLAAAGLGIGWWQLNSKIRTLAGEERRLTAELAEREKGEFLSWGNEFNQVVQAAGLIEVGQTSLAGVMLKLSELMPRTVRLTSFSYSAIGGRWSMSGTADKRADVLVLGQTLKGSEVFKQARLYFSSLESDEGVVFRLSGGEND